MLAMRSLLQTHRRLFSDPGLLRSTALQRRFLKKLHPKDPNSKYDRKVEAALQEWEQQAEAIRKGQRQSMLTILESRGLINAIAGDRNELEKALTNERIGAYSGIDPTASSMHLGHLLPMMALFWMFIHGYEVIALLGGSTAAVGDPTDRITSREAIKSATRRANIASMHMQLKRLWKHMEHHATSRHGYEWNWAWRRGLWNNTEWLNKTTIHEFMSQLGNGTRLGPLLSRDTIKNKIEKGDGVSFSELAYPLLQAWDWWIMYQRRGISVQIGGADQYGNIISGMDSVNYLRKNAAQFAPTLAPEYKERTFFGLTVPLLTTSSGEKFGKSAGNAIWLDENLTSPMELYQYLLRTADADVERYLRLFTLLKLETISSLMEIHEQDRGKRVPQRKLAQEVVTMIHGEAQTKQVEAGLQALYSSHRTSPSQFTDGDTSQITSPKSSSKDGPITSFTAGAVRTFLPQSAVQDKTFAAVIYAAGLANSRSEANRLITAGGAYVGSQPGRQLGWRQGGSIADMGDSLKFLQIQPWGKDMTKNFIHDDNLLILRAGKWRVRVIEIIPDAEYLKKGLPGPPGWIVPSDLLAEAGR